MDLDGVKKIESADFYIDLAFRHATKEANDVRSAKLKGTREEKSKKIEITKIMAISDTISSAMMKLIQSYPDLDGMTEFYKKLFRVFIDMKQMKLSLGGLNWLREKIVLFGNLFGSSLMIRAFAVNQLFFSKKTFASLAIKSRIFAEVDVVLIVHFLQNILDCLHMVFVGCSDKIVRFNR